MLSFKIRQVILCFVRISNRTDYARYDRQVLLRSLTAFLLRFAIRGRWEISSPIPPARGPVPRPLLRFASILVFLYKSQIERNYARNDRQFSLPPLTVFLLRFAIRERWEISSPIPPAWGPVPRFLLLFASILVFYLRIAYFYSHGSFLCVKNKQLAEFRHSAGCFFYTIPDNRYARAFLICPASTCNAGSGSRHRRFHPCRTGRCAWASPARVQPSCEPYSSRGRRGTCRTPSG